jgi:phosphoesterase RecJ-like protein
MSTTATEATLAQVAEAIRARDRFVVVSHVRPDGDAVGSQLAMTFALRRLGKQVRAVSRDPAPAPMQALPGVAGIEIMERIDDAGDAVLVMECGDLRRTGIEGLDRGFVINIDHHPGNAMYGALNWLDLSAAACGEMAFDLVRALGVPLTPEIATHLYVAILTDTGSFRHSNITPRTFDICRQCVEAGVSAPSVARTIYDSGRLGRLKLLGSILNGMQIDRTGRIATIDVTEQQARDCGGTYEDTDDLVNMPLSVKEIVAVAFFKETGPGEWRVSLRSKGAIDVNAVAKQYGGGGHKNASGCSAHGALEDVRATFTRHLADAVKGAAEI